MEILQTPVFNERGDRTRWIYQNFAHLFNGATVLDVGCYEAPLRDLVGAERYTGVDFVGKPDIRINLEHVDCLPFRERQFDTTICIEVLEHLDNLHVLAGELFRVTGRSVLISLPNAWRDARVKVARGKGNIAHYGLPLIPPIDRHKWFFNTGEAVDFLENLTPNGWHCRICLTEPDRNVMLRRLRQLRYSCTAYQNRYCQTVWAEYARC